MNRLSRVMILSIISVGLFAVIAALLPGIDAFEPIGKSLNDISVSDLFYSSARDEEAIDNDKFLLVNTADSDRGEIAEAIAAAVNGGAAVVGVDIIFSLADVDSVATRALCDTMATYSDCIVKAVHLNYWDDASKSYLSTVVTPTDTVDARSAYTNLMTFNDNSYIRNYTIAAQGLTPSFAQAITENYCSVFDDTLTVGETDEGIIDFTPQRFEVVAATDTDAIRSLSGGRMVLLGAVNADEDMHYTPIGSMSGVEIQAYAIETILNNPSSALPWWALWCVCIAVVILAAYGFVVIRDKFESQNAIGNRYVYATLGLINITYPTAVIILTIFTIGIIYLMSSLYIRPLVIVGSLAFIPVVYDLMGLAVNFFGRPRKSTAAVALLIAASMSASAQNNTYTKADFEKDIEYLNLNCPIKDGLVDTTVNVGKNLNDVYGSRWMPRNDNYDMAYGEFFSELGDPYAKCWMADLYLGTVNSSNLAKGVKLLDEALSSLPDKPDAVYGSHYYKLALCQYFGLGTEIDYARSAANLNKAHEMYVNMSDSQKEDFGFYGQENGLNLLGSALYHKGFPNSVYGSGDKARRSQPGSMALFGRVGYFRDQILRECEDELKYEDPEHLMKDYPKLGFMLDITPMNFLRFYPLIVKSGNALDFLKRCEKSEHWKDRLLLALIYYHYIDGNFGQLHLIRPLAQSNQFYHFDDYSERGEYYSAKLFKQAYKKIKSAQTTGMAEDLRKRLLDFTEVYIRMSEEGGGSDRDEVMAAAMSVNLRKSVKELYMFNNNHFGNIVIASNYGDEVARFLMGYMYAEGKWGTIRQDTDKAREILSQWKDHYSGLEYQFKDPDDVFDFIAGELKHGLDNEFYEAAASIYMSLPVLPEGRFKTELLSYQRRNEIEKAFAQGKLAMKIEDYIKQFTDPKSASGPAKAKSKSNATKGSNRPAAAKKYTAKGIVLDNLGEPLIAATVYHSGGTVKSGTATDLDGRFSLAINKGDTIKVSYVGYNLWTQVYTGYDVIAVLQPTVDSQPLAKAEAPKAETPSPSKSVRFLFRTPDYTKFSDSEFDLTFTTNSSSATYRISGSEPHEIPASALAAGKYRITLPQRDCELTLVDESSKMHVLRFIYDESLSLRKSATLHILSIGVNDYPAQDLTNLKFAEADAEAVVDAFVKRHKYTFSNIDKTVLLGNNVTRQRIESELDKIADTAKPNDLAVVFFAGHGLVDSRNYYLATSEVTDATTPRKGGVSASVFKEKIEYIPCKLVVFIDACYSAKLLESFRAGSVNNGEFFKELKSTPNGTSIYTSSGADVRSKEDPKLGHGVFTKALIESCDFENSDADNDGRITIKEIRNYLERRIPQLTKNQQKPVYRNLEEIDFSIFIKQ